MKNLFCFSALAALSFGALSTSADVVMWYRFDDLAAGQVANGSQKLVNTVNPGTLDLTLYSYSGTSAGTDTSLMPIGTNSISSAFKIWDPLTGQYHDNERAMHFGARGAMSGTAMPGSIAGSGVANQPIFNRFTNVTVEAIFRLKEDAPSGLTACIVQKNSNDGTYRPNWGLTINDGGLWQRYTHVKADGTKSTEEGFQGGGAISRGVWHHAAFTYDANGTARLFLDYQEVATRTTAGYIKLYTTPNNSIVIGARTGVSNSTFPGEIDEVRICDTALDPRQFLRIKPVVNGMDPDTLFYLPCDFGEAAPPVTAMDINAATNAGALAANFVYADATQSVPSGAVDVPGDSGVLRQNVLAETQGNGGSMYVQTNVVGKGTSVRVSTPDHALYTGSFTAEMFFKSDTTKIDPNGSALTLMWGQLKVLLGANGGMRCRAYSRIDGYEWSTDEISLDHLRLHDGAWHHVAFVYDYPRSNLVYYIDYQSKGEQKKVRIYEKSNGVNSFNFGQQVDANNGPQYFPGWMDSLRIVKRALKPSEFLTTYPLATQPRTLAHYAFDEDFSVQPYPSVEQTGTTNVIDNVAGGGLPELDPGQKFSTPLYLDGEEKHLAKVDGGSVKMNGGQVRYPRNDLLERTSFTLEFFARIESFSGTAQFLRLNRGTGNWNNYSTWAPEVGQDRHFAIHAYTRKSDGTFVNASPDFSGTSGKLVPNDGRWHHYAITSEVVDGNTRLTAYIDYEPVADPVVQEGVFYYPPEGTCFSVCAGNIFQGWINEIRFSDGVLPVSAFMRLKRNGLAIVLR